MARQTPDGLLKVWWVPVSGVDIADTSLPELVTEIQAGTELTPFLAPAGLMTPDEGSEADASDLSSVRDKSIPSTIGGNIEGEFYRDDTPANDDAWTELARGTSGYLVIAPFGGSGAGAALAASDVVEVWTVRVSNRNPNRYTRGDAIKFTATFTVEEDPVYDAVVTVTP